MHNKYIFCPLHISIQENTFIYVTFVINNTCEHITIKINKNIPLQCSKKKDKITIYF